MFSRYFRPRAMIVCVVLLAGSTAQAGPIAISEVTQYFSRYRSALELQVSSGSRTGVPASGVNGPTQETSGVKQSVAGLSSEAPPPSATGVATTNSSDSLLSGVAVVDQGDLEGTICDCGEITVAAGGLPKWPLVFLAAIPLFFIHGCDHCDTPLPPITPPITPPLVLTSPSPTPPVSQVPEPTSLLLLGSGLVFFGAFFRRRYARSKLAAQIFEEVS